MDLAIKKSKPKPPAQKILIIEDEKEIRNIITSALTLVGYETLEAQNGLEGLAMVKMDSPDLILCDIKMPKMDGSALLSTLKNEPEFADIPFIFLTGNSSADEMRNGMQLGADDYLTKPFTVKDLIAAVQTRLTKKKSLQKYYESQFDDIKLNIISSLPHEYRTPLSCILGFAQILKDESTMSAEEVKEIGGLIEKSGERLQHLLENMILFGQLQVWMHDQEKIQQLRSESSQTALNIIQSIAEKQMAKHDRANAVHLSLQKPFHLQISPLHLTKIIDEIIDNALKFSKSGTTVQISCVEKESEIQIIIQDEGRGIPEDHILKVSGFHQFERKFYEQQGAGLGLVVAKMLAELYRGTLSLISTVNKGTTVTISLPKGM